MNHMKTIKLFFVTFLIFIYSTLSFAGEKISEKVTEKSIVSNGFADIVEGLLPSVVNISTTQKDKDDVNGVLSKLPEDKVFDQLRDRLKKQSVQQKKSSSLGSGFIISKDGYIVTKYHVIENAAEIFANLSDGKKFTAKVIGVDKKTDMAVLNISAGYDLQFVKFGNSNDSRIGDWVIVIGNPFGLGGSVSVGIISARGRDVIAGQGDFLQTDAAINRGNSGGPLFNIKGEVIGIATAIFSTSGGNIGIGFAGTSNDSVPIIEQLKTQGAVVRGWIGVSVQDVSEDIAKALKMEKARGAMVISNIKDGPAEEAGILPSDVIIKFDGKNIEDIKTLPQVAAITPIGKMVKVVVIRQGKEEVLTVKVQKMPENLPDNSDEKNKDKKVQPTAKILAMGVVDIDKKIQSEYKIDDKKGVLVADVATNSNAAELGIQAGDIILSANQIAVKSIKSLQKIILTTADDEGDAILLLIKRKDHQFSAVVKLK